jgi:hypothetical protein
MTNLAELQTRHRAILKTFNQVESVLAPIHTGTGKNDCVNILPDNIERLAKQSDFLSSDFCSIKVVSEQIKSGSEFETQHKINITGESFSYIFAPESLPGLMKAIKKSFKEAESFTKKAVKQNLSKGRVNIPAPEQVPEKAPKNENKPVPLAAEKLITVPAVLKIDKTNSVKKQFNVYICDNSNNESDMLALQIKRKEFELIKAGTKKTEWRTPSKFNKRRLLSVNADGKFTRNTSIKELKFINGRTKDAPTLIAEVTEIIPVKFQRDVYIPEDDFRGHQGECAIAIKLGKIKQV